MKGLFFEEIAEGQTETLGSYHFTREAIISYARKYDPQPFHLDEEAGRRSHFGSLCASGWHTCAAWMKCFVSFNDRHMTMRRARGETAAQLGPSPGFENLRWLKPVYAGETLHCRRTTLEARRSASRPDMGLVKFRWELFGAEGEKTTDIVATCLLAVRAAK